MTVCIISTFSTQVYFDANRQRLYFKLGKKKNKCMTFICDRILYILLLQDKSTKSEYFFHLSVWATFFSY